MLKYSMVVTTRRGIDSLRGLFDVSRKDVELIIIDSNYSLESLEKLRTFPHQFGLVVYAPQKERKVIKNYDMINALNTAYAYAEGDWLIRVDDCTELDPEFFERLDETLKVHSFRGDDKYVVRQMELEAGMGDRRWVSFIKGPHFRYYSLPNVPIGRTIPIQTAGLCICPRSLMELVNGIDERYDEGLGWTDNDMFCRVLVAGYQWVFDTELMIFRNLHNSSGIGNPRETNRNIFMGIFENEFKKGVFKSQNDFDFQALHGELSQVKQSYIVNGGLESRILDYWENRTPMTWGSYEEMHKLRYELQDYMHQVFGFDKWAGKKVLEVGCGSGLDAIEFAKHGAEVWATDMTDNAFEYTKAFALSVGAKMTIEKANALRLPYEDNFFDLVFCFGVLHHSPEPEKMLKEFQRVLKPGGSCYVTVYNRDSMLYYYSILWLRGINQDGFLNGETEQSLLSRYSEGKEGCPYTKVYTMDEARELFSKYFSSMDFSVEYPVVDTLDRRKLKPPGLPKELGWHLIIKAVK